ncbi:Mur ligase family protein [Helicobacter sp. MIT 01-3238]|uniref:Mur ligase family protein n=1 Tax=Helicobacter sp. MIT 01-3238 TaxID=398627 RepID=UPI000E38AC66|nr:Mur ligase family protein [Helicobacter sp. MIT 01-3238]RDU52237.1 bifunctional folylpolyglutamate synthase/dihydrofolate synthase [Helicobacter sp. MIT 01-3238]
MSDLDRFLEQKGAEYAPFDTKRVHRIYAVLKPHLEELYAQSAKSKKDLESLIPQSKERCSFSTQNKPFIIHILGTNGKGSTGRFITLGLAQNGYKVLHFTSPHLFRFNERFYLANIPNSDLSAKSSSANSSKKNCAKDCGNAHKGTHRIADDSELEKAHLWLQRFPIIEQSSYFEYATFLALYLAKDCDYFVCEAGLGGEFDSTSVLQADLSVFTPISFDHQDMLGNSIESIATTKLKAMSKHTLLAHQIYKEVDSIAKSIAKQKRAELTFVENIFDEVDKPTPLEHLARLTENFYEYSQNLAPFLKQNLFVAYRALESIGIGVDFASLTRFDLPARAQYIAPNILIDVGHNAHCAHSILQIVKQKRVILVYNTFFDKDANAILGILKPAIDRLLILEVSHSRILPKDKLINIAQNLGIEYGIFEGVDSMRADKDYVVFGSFSVVKTFMEIYNVAR